MAETLADLMAQVGIGSYRAAGSDEMRAPRRTPGPYRNGYRPGAELPAWEPPQTRPRPRQGDYARERQYALTGARDRLWHGDDLPERLSGAGELLFEQTGIPALGNHFRARAHGDTQSAATEGGVGLLQALGAATMVPGRGMFGRGPAVRTPAAPAMRNVTPTPELPAIARRTPDDVAAQWNQTVSGLPGVRQVDMAPPVFPPSRPDPSAAFDRVVGELRDASQRVRGVMGIPESPTPVPLATRPQTRASDGSILPRREPQPFRRTAATSEDLAGAARGARSIDLNELPVVDRRYLLDDRVDEYAALDTPAPPIRIAPNESGGWRVLDGHNRIAAARQKRQPTISAVVEGRFSTPDRPLP